MDTKKIGDITEAVLITAFLKSGKKVLSPFGEGQYYDLVIEENNSFKTVQCKTGRLTNGCVKFNLYSVVRDSKTKKYVKHFYSKFLDYYGVYCPEINRAFLVPANELPKTIGSLRLIETKASKAKNATMASFYELKL